MIYVNEWNFVAMGAKTKKISKGTVGQTREMDEDCTKVRSVKMTR